MTGNELLGEIILSLNTYLGFNNTDLKDLIEIDGNIEDGFHKLISLGLPVNFETFVKSLNEIRIQDRDGFLSQPYSITGDPIIINFNQPKFEKKIRSFAYSNTDYSYVSSSAFFENTDFIELDKIENQVIWKQVEEFLVRAYTIPQLALVDDLFNIISSTDKLKGLLVYKATDPFIEDKHYPFIYLAFLNDGKSLILDNKLKYSNSNLNPGLVYDPTKEYDQFFDIYDVINELNQSGDIINRFLRLYHAFEYLVYRIYLVELVSRVGTNKIFVREFIGASENMKKGEKDSFKTNFSKIFTPDLTSIQASLTPLTGQPVIDFLKEKKIISGFQDLSISKISEIIYGIRCCIVHNKESEYHITLSNFEDYEIIIPLITEIIKIFENLVIQKLADNYLPIKYGQQSLNLY